MKRDNLPWRAVRPAALNWTDAGTPSSTDYGDVYYSRDNGLAESRHVFLQGNALQQRWSAHPRPHFCIGELGFGTGLNFVLTWQAWREQPGPRPDLHYVAVENQPLTRSDLHAALSAWPTLADLASALRDAYPGLLPGQHRILLEDGRVRLDLWWADVDEALADLAGYGRALVDAWYLDGFAPSRNAAMWSAGVFAGLATLSLPGATFSTFTAAGRVRRDLEASGFAVARVPGYGRKRESLRGEFTGRRPPQVPAGGVNWDQPARAPARPGSAIVVGGGLAGCTTAAALASRGVAVTVLEQGALAQGGSGNAQGILYTRLSHRHSALVDFALQAYHFACAFYRDMFRAGRLAVGRDGELCGTFQQYGDSAELAALGMSLTGVEELARVVDACEAGALLGVAQPSAGYWLPGSGWLHPGAVCRALVAHPGIRVLEHRGEIALRAEGAQWQARAGEQTIAQADCAIVATGATGRPLAQLAWLPLQRIRGQVTELPGNTALGPLRAALCHTGYIAPASAGRYSVGATFAVGATDCELRAEDHRENLAKLAAAMPTWRDALASLDPATLGGRVGFRCASRDHLPVVGPAPDVDAFQRDFAGLRVNARQHRAGGGSFLPGLYVNTAHGSRGLAYTPLAAELLASMICDEPPPLQRNLCRALAPARFIVRDLSRGRARS